MLTYLVTALTGSVISAAIFFGIIATFPYHDLPAVHLVADQNLPLKVAVTIVIYAANFLLLLKTLREGVVSKEIPSPKEAFVSGLLAPLNLLIRVLNGA